ncbi:ATP-binding protein [Nonomuraea sp. NPDC000554]|uniref:ATP-binding protein n=1 Tax=Nonomuraea sp. NPDC000554 TaxID=3154259 RepID=UPI003332F832
MLCATFAGGRVAVLRRAVREHAAGLGLAGRRLEDFVLAVNEVVTNAVVHGGGGGRLRLWPRAGSLWCEVVDDGPGLPSGWTSWTRASKPPPGLATGGRGLWLTCVLCDQVTIVSGPGGTRVTVAAVLE